MSVSNRCLLYTSIATTNNKIEKCSTIEGKFPISYIPKQLSVWARQTGVKGAIYDGELNARLVNLAHQLVMHISGFQLRF